MSPADTSLKPVCSRALVAALIWVTTSEHFAAVVEHAFDAGELAADAVQALADVVDDLFGQLHRVLGCRPGPCHIPLRVS